MSTALAGRPVVPFHPPTTTTTTTTTTLKPYVAPPAKADLGPLSPVPDVTGYPVGEALDVLRHAGFRAAVAPASGSDEPPGTVVVQSPAAGSAPPGSTVTIEVTS